MIEYRVIVSTVKNGERVEIVAGTVAVPESLPSDGEDYTPEHEAALALRWGKDRHDGFIGWKFERVERITK